MGYSSSYGIQFKGEFDSIPRNGSSDRYYFNISKKGADENISNVLCGANPVIHSYLNDEPKTYLKGSELEVTLINKDNSLPLSTFYSEEDDAWKIDFYVVLDIGFPPVKETLLFSGYLTIENCTEVLTDITHEIKLVFTDNLGELKNIKLEDALRQTPKKDIPTETTNNAYFQVKQDNDGIRYFQIQFDAFANWTGGPPELGDVILVENCIIANGYYTVASATQVGISLPVTWEIYVIEEMPDVSQSASQNPYIPNVPSGTQGNITILKPYKKTDIIPLIDIYWILLYSTGIKLDFFVPNMLTETSGATPVTASRMLEYVYISLDTFFDNNSSDDLDEVCEKLGYRFGTSLFQADGQWNLVRWNELRNTQEIVANPATLNILQADWYGKNDFNWVNKVPITKKRNIGNGEDIEFGIEGSILRPLKFVEHCYKYSQNDNVPFNGDFKTIGKLIKQYTTGTGTNLKYFKEYEALGWRDIVPWIAYSQPSTIRPVRYIRVEYDYLGNEQDRYLVIDIGNGASVSSWLVCSEYPFQMNKGDEITISFSIRTGSNHSGTGVSYARIPALTTDPNDDNAYSCVGFGTIPNEDGFWGNNKSIAIAFSDNWDQWQDITVVSKPVPFDGKSYICLPSISAASETKTYIKNVKIDYKPYLGNSNNNEGHCHKTTKYAIIKNSESEDIYIDDTQKDYSKGTLFLYSMTGILRNRSKIWFDGAGLTASLGEIITRQENLWRSKTRLKLEGNLFPVVINQGTTDVQCLSMLNVIKFLIDSSKYLVFGKLEIDYKMNQSKFTAYEIWREGEVYWVNTGTQIVEVGANIDKDIKYTFKYITE